MVSENETSAVAQAEKKKGRGGRRPGAGRPKGSTKDNPGKRKAFMCYLSRHLADRFEFLAAAADMTPYKLLQTLAKAAALEGVEEADAFKDEWSKDREGRLSFTQIVISVKLRLTSKNFLTQEQEEEIVGRWPEGAPEPDDLDPGWETEWGTVASEGELQALATRWNEEAEEEGRRLLEKSRKKLKGR